LAAVDRPTTVALALGSGGARGYAHIGAIQVLEERGYHIAGVAGTSMGALVGGLHAAGRLGEYTEWSLGLTRSDLVRLLDVSLSAPGAIKAGRIFARVQELAGDARIEDLPIPTTIVATDLLARKEVWFQRGPLDLAIRASIAIPSIITPVVLNGRLLADGGLMNPVPIAPTASIGADITLAITLNGEARAVRGAGPAAESAEPRPVEEWGDRFRRGVRNLTSRFGGAADVVTDVVPEPADDDLAPEFGELPAGLGKLDVMNLSIESMQSVLTRYRLAGNPPDVLVTVPKDACRSLEFHRAAEMIALGRQLTERALDTADL
jgi:NTE family protein